ncbi:unnamed protein product [Rhizophagus irregularis]|nr:unnamed protein product [Rhizophagus irregularis]
MTVSNPGSHHSIALRFLLVRFIFYNFSNCSGTVEEWYFLTIFLNITAITVSNPNSHYRIGKTLRSN